jgi:hypothetical protein
MTKTKIALAAVLVAATSSAAFAAPARVQHHRNVQTQQSVLQQRDVALPTESQSASGPIWFNGNGPTTGGGL